ncbi:FecR family protein [Pseudomonas sp. NPDC089406]|uniref:FecR family protein n=1 Tax=Pseudomonas sp. NPDC089406 TaxID=3364463 RepID=UPI00384D1BCE
MADKTVDSVLREAAQWLVLLDNQVDAQLQAQFQAWVSAAPEHAAAVARLQGRMSSLQQLPRQAAGKALRRAPRAPMANKMQALALAIALLPVAWITTTCWQQGYLLADLSTSGGDWLDRRLDDDSQIHLDGGSAVNVHFDAGERRIELLRGEVLVDVAKDPRPFLVVTAHGSVRALGTRFTVERQDDSTQVTMIESTTAISSAGHVLKLTANQRVRLAAQGPGKVEQVQADALEQAWRKHQLLAEDQPLSDVLTRLSRHYPGLLLADHDALAGLRVTVMLPLDDPRQALRLLQRTLPIQVSQYTPWITRVTLKHDAGRK